MVSCYLTRAPPNHSQASRYSICIPRRDRRTRSPRLHAKTVYPASFLISSQISGAKRNVLSILDWAWRKTAIFPLKHLANFPKGNWNLQFLGLFPPPLLCAWYNHWAYNIVCRLVCVTLPMGIDLLSKLRGSISCLLYTSPSPRDS